MKPTQISFRKTETVPEGMIRISCRLIDDAVEQITNPSIDRAEDVHEIRVAVKRLRAMLRLVKPAIGKAVFRRENAILGKIAHRLAFSRDTAIIQQTLAALSKSVSRKSDRNAITLVLSRFQTMLDPKLEQILQSVARNLEQEITRIRKLSFTGDPWEAVGLGLEKVYAQCRKRMNVAYAQGSHEAFHQWRIRVKNLYYQLQFLEPIWPKQLGNLITRLKKLQHTIGADHDLAIVKRRLQKSPEAFGGAQAVGQVVASLEKKSQKLRRETKPRGQSIFEEKNCPFARKLVEKRRAWTRENKECRRCPRALKVDRPVSGFAMSWRPPAKPNFEARIVMKNACKTPE